MKRNHRRQSELEPIENCICLKASLIFLFDEVQENFSDPFS